MDDRDFISALQAKLKRPNRESYGGRPFSEVFQELRNKYPANIFPAEIQKRITNDDLFFAQNVLNKLLSPKQPQKEEVLEDTQKKHLEDEKKDKSHPKINLFTSTKATQQVEDTPAKEPEKTIPSSPQIPYVAKNAAKNLGTTLLIFTKKGLARTVGAVESFIYSREALGAGSMGNSGGVQNYQVGEGSPEKLSYPTRRSPQSFSSGNKSFSAKGVNFFKGRALIIFFIILLIIILLSMISGSLSLPDPLSGITAGNISQCRFTRSDQNPREASFKSPLLMSYMEEASKLTEIPLVVLAAFMRVESPSSVNYTDEQVQNYQCAKSITGALGIMQIQPVGTKGHDDPAVANGAKLLGIDYNSLTEADYCDVRKSIIMGAGFILKKMSYLGFGDGTKWKPEWNRDQDAIYALAKSYYGCINYGGSDPLKCEGPYNYGQDVFNSIISCQQGAPSTSSGFTKPEGFVYYCQGDPKWDNKTGCGIGQIGCGPTSLAMVFSSLGKRITPDQTYQTFASQGRINCTEGSYMTTILSDKEWMQSQGFTVGPNLTANGNLILHRAKDYIEGDYLIIGSSQTFPSYQTPGVTFPHIFVIDGVDVTNKTFSNRDPANCDYSTGQEVVSRQVRPANGPGGLNWAYAFPIKKIESKKTE